MIFKYSYNIQWAFLSFISLYFVTGCKHSQTYNGRYCTKVEYFNPNTGTSSDYKLIVSVKDNQLLKLEFPQGYLDNIELPTTKFSSNGHTSFTLENGHKYTIDITGPENHCFDNEIKPTQCKGITKKGIRCKKLTDNTNGFCHIHKNQ